MELICYPDPHHETRAATNATIAAISVVRLECDHSLSREDQGRRHRHFNFCERNSWGGNTHRVF